MITVTIILTIKCFSKKSKKTNLIVIHPKKAIRDNKTICKISSNIDSTI